MATRCLITAEIATAHGGDWALCAEMIRAAADSGADTAKLQAFDASRLRDDDPQKAWLTQSQLTPAALDELLKVAASRQIQLMASVFDIASAEMMRDAGVDTVKLGSGEVQRRALLIYCAEHFEHVWISTGIIKPAVELEDVLWHYGISQYPTPSARAQACLLQIDKRAPFAWTDHCLDLSICFQALAFGCARIERHFCLPHMGRRQDWCSTPAQLLTLRKHAELCAWEQTPEWEQAKQQYLHRWTHGVAE